MIDTLTPIYVGDIENTSLYALRLSIKNRIDMLNDNHEYAVTEEFKRQFVTKIYKRMKNLLSIENNIFTKIHKMQSKVYLNPAIRRLETNGKNDKSYADIIKETNIDAIMPTVNLLTNACNEVVVKTSWTGKRVFYDIITLDNVLYTVDPADQMGVREFSYLSGDWRITYFKGGENDGRILKQYMRNNSPHTGAATDAPKVQSMWDENPYKDENNETLLPFTFFHSEYPYLGLVNYSKGNDLYMFTIQVNIFMTYLNYLIKMQSYQQPYVTGLEVKLPKDAYWDAGKIQVFEGEGVTAGLLDLHAPFADVWDVIHKRAIAIAQNYNLSMENFTLSGSPTSGFALKLSNRGIDEKLTIDRQYYRLWETHLHNVTTVINNHHNDKKININGSFSIDFAELEYDESPTEADNHQITLINNDIETPIDWIKKREPGLDRCRRYTKV